jgi:hypothetical protein
MDSNTVSCLSVTMSERLKMMKLGELTFTNRQSRTPLVSQDIQTDASIGINVGVVDSCDEVDLWWLERVVGGEVDG